IYPPLTPMVQVIDVPSASENIVVVVKVPESIEAPHAVEGSTKVYVRVNSTSQPIDLAEIDRIDYLLKRRHDPKQRRQQMIETAIKRSRVAAPCIRIMIGPRYPYRPLLTGEELGIKLKYLESDGTYGRLAREARRVNQGF